MSSNNLNSRFMWGVLSAFVLTIIGIGILVGVMSSKRGDNQRPNSAVDTINVPDGRARDRSDDTPESRKNTPLDKVVEMSVTIEQPSWTDREQVRRRFTYLYPQLSKTCGGTVMQHGSVAAALWGEVKNAGVNESFLDFMERYHFMVARVDLNGNLQRTRSESCRELLAMYTTIRTSGKSSKDAADDVVYVISYMGWDKWQQFNRLTR